MLWITLTVFAVLFALGFLLFAEDPVAKVLGTVVTTVVWVVITGFMSFTVIQPGYQGVLVTFGDVHEETISNGLKWKNPVSKVIHYRIKRDLIDMRSDSVATEKGVKVISSDKVQLWVDIAFPYSLRGENANWLYSEVGVKKRFKNELLYPAARKAAKNAAAEFTWIEMAVTDKKEYAQAVRDRFIETVREDISSNGLKDKTVFQFHPVQLRNVEPPKKLQNSINERMAAKEDLKRQKTLTKIAKREAERRKNVGSGIAKMFKKLPEGYNADEMSKILNSIAQVRRAKAVTTAIERGQVNWGLFTGGNGAVPGMNANK